MRNLYESPKRPARALRDTRLRRRTIQGVRVSRRKWRSMMEALLLKLVVVAKAVLGLGKTPLLVAGKAPSVVLGVAVTLALFVTLLFVGLGVVLSLVVGLPFSRARTASSGR